MTSTTETTDVASDVLVRCRGLHFRQGNRAIYQGIDVDIRRGKVTAILGPSGTGKTTLLRLIGGQWRPNAGTVVFDGIDVHKAGRKALYDLRKRMGMLFQNGALLTDLTVFENVAYPIREHAELPESMVRDLVLMKLQAVGLRGARDLYPEELSGGMARRVALARAIALDPDMVMYDEPFTGQDPISMAVLIKLIRTPIADPFGSPARTVALATFTASSSILLITSLLLDAYFYWNIVGFAALMPMLAGRGLDTFGAVLTEVRKHGRLLKDLN